MRISDILRCKPPISQCKECCVVGCNNNASWTPILHLTQVGYSFDMPDYPHISIEFSIATCDKHKVDEIVENFTEDDIFMDGVNIKLHNQGKLGVNPKDYRVTWKEI